MGLREQAAEAARLDAAPEADPASTPAPETSLDTLRAEDPPQRVMAHGGIAQYAEAMSEELTKAIEAADWDLVRQIANDAWVGGDSHDRAMGALAGANELEPKRRGVPEANVHYPERPTVIHATPLRLTPQQYAVLLKPIDTNRISREGGQTHVEAWDVRRYHTRIFGFGGYRIENRLEKIHEKLTPNGTERFKYTVVYSCETRLTILNPDGSVGALFEDAATGDGINMPTYQKAADFAIKTAASQALKRCAVNLGDQFGLSLYNGGSAAAVVERTLAGPVVTDAPGVVELATRSGVVQGELIELVQHGEAGVAALAEDPGAASDNGLPSASELGAEALQPQTPEARLSQIYRMVHRTRGDHPTLGTARVFNENGDEESLDHLVHRQIKERQQAAGNRRSE